MSYISRQMQKVTINPTIAAEVNIGPVFQKEKVNIYFTASEDWTGAFEFQLFETAQKFQKFNYSDALTIDQRLMTLAIDPIGKSLLPALYYYEIWHLPTNRIYFKGTLNIVR